MEVVIDRSLNYGMEQFKKQLNAPIWQTKERWFSIKDFNEIQRLRTLGFSLIEIANKFEVSENCIFEFLNKAKL